MARCHLDFSQCVVGVLLEESNFIGFQHGPMFCKMSVPELPVYHDISILVAPRFKWVAGLIRKAPDAEDDIQDLFTLGLAMALNEQRRPANLLDDNSNKHA